MDPILCRSSRLNRVRRSISDNSLSETISAGERAERLVSLLRILQDADPAFDANDFLKVQNQSMRIFIRFEEHIGILS